MTRPSRISGAATGWAVLVASFALIAGCSGGSGGSGPDGPKPAETTSGASSSADGGAGDAAARTYLGGQPAKPIGSASGTIATYTSTAPATADVLAVTAGATTTLRWQLSSPQAGTTMKGGFLGEDGASGTGGVVILARQANLRLTPLTVDGACVCSEVPSKLGSRPVAMSGVYPPLPSGVTEVEVAVPGFPAIKVPVSRA